MASTSVSKTESPGSNPGAPAKMVFEGLGRGRWNMNGGHTKE